MKTECPHCQGSLDFSRKLAGTVAECPYCQQELTLPARAPVNWNRRIRILAYVTIPVFIIGIGLIVWQYRGFLPTIDPDKMGGAVGAIAMLAVIALIAMWALFWIFFPLMVWFKFNELIEEQRKLRDQLRRSQMPAI